MEKNKKINKDKIKIELLRLDCGGKYYELRQMTYNGKLQKNIELIDKELSIKKDRVTVIAKYCMNNTLCYLASDNLVYNLSICNSLEELKETMLKYFDLVWEL